MTGWPQDFAKKLVEAHRMKEPLPACPPPCHGPILVSDGGADDREIMLKCVRCGALTTYPSPPTD